MPIVPVSGEIKSQNLNDNFSYLDSKIASVDGGPAEVFNSLSALQIKYPNGTNSVMLVTDTDGKNGFLYYWDSSWKKGPLYSSEGLSNLSVETEKIALSSVTESRLPYPVARAILGNNLYNKDYATDNRILDKGFPVINKYDIDFTVTDYIAVKPNTTYRRNDANTSYFYSKDGLVISSIPSVIFTTPSNCYFIRCTIETDNKDKFMVYKGSNAIPYEDYQASLDTTVIKDKTIPLNKLEKEVITGNIGKNLFDKNSAIKGAYINYLDGKVIVSAYDFYASDFIRIDANKNYHKNNAQQYAYYTKDQLFISGEASGQVLTPPGNAKYVRVTVPGSMLDSFQIELGTSFSRFEPYGYYVDETILSPKIISKINSIDISSEVKILLPSKIYLTANEEFSIYWRNVTKYADFIDKNNLAIRLQEKTSSGYLQLGTDIGYKWFWIPDKEENKTIEIRITDPTNDTIIDSKIVLLIVSENLRLPSTKTLVTVGDSFTDGYEISKNIYNFVTEDANKRLNMIGNNDTGLEGVKDDAWSGQGYQWYHDSDRGYLRSDRPLSDAYWDDGWGLNETNGWKEGQTYFDLTAEQRIHGFTKNQFFNPETKKFDFNYYMSNYMDNVKIDGFLSLLGLNDAIWKSPATLKSLLPALKTRIDNMISSVQDYDSSIVIMIGLVTPQAENDSYMNSYGIDWGNSKRCKISQEIWNEFIIENYDNQEGNVHVIASHTSFDYRYALKTTTIKPVKYLDIIETITDDVHPIPEIGGKQIADNVRNAINGLMF